MYNNPMEFVNLCLLLDCHPDLNNVKIWSNWLTPGNQYLTTRYDSKFFLVMFNDTDLPKCDIDYCEMKSLQVGFFFFYLCIYYLQTYVVIFCI